MNRYLKPHAIDEVYNSPLATLTSNLVPSIIGSKSNGKIKPFSGSIHRINASSLITSSVTIFTFGWYYNSASLLLKARSTSSLCRIARFKVFVRLYGMSVDGP